MALTISKKRKFAIESKGTRPTKKQRARAAYHSSSSSEDGEGGDQSRGVPLDKSSEPISKPGEESQDAASTENTEDESSEAEASTASGSSASDSGSENSQTEHATTRKRSKRNDPSAFSSSVSAILNSKLATAKRTEPILSRSKDAALASSELASSRLEAKAKRKLRDEKRVASEKGRVKDVLLGEKRTATAVVNAQGDVELVEEGLTAGQIRERETRLRKTAQRGVIKLFNAVRAAQVKAEQAEREMEPGGVVGLEKRREKVGEEGRKAFLELVGAAEEG